MEPSEKWKIGPNARGQLKRMLEQAMTTLCLLVLILISLDPVHGVMEVIQHPFSAMTIGGSVSLNCTFVYSTESIQRQRMYWYIKPTNEDVVIYPGTKPPYKGRIALLKAFNGNLTEKSIQISDLRFNDTMVYYCMMSIVTQDSENLSTVNGNGTLLFVHGALSLKTSYDNTSLVCEVQVWRTQDVDIVWKEEDNEISAENMTVVQTELGTYRITSQLHVPSHLVYNKNFTCLLRHRMGGDLSHQRMEISGRLFARNQNHKEPTLLYVMLLVNQVLILTIVLVFFRHQDAQKRCKNLI